MDLYKIKLILLMALFRLLKFVFIAIGSVGVLLNSFGIGYNWYRYNTDPMEYNWDLQFDRTLRYGKALIEWTGAYAIAFAFHAFLLMTKENYQRYILEHRDDCNVVNASDSLINKKDSNMAVFITY